MFENGKTAPAGENPRSAGEAEGDASAGQADDFLKRENFYGDTFDSLLETFGGTGDTKTPGALPANSAIQISLIGWVRSSLRQGDDLAELEKAPEAMLEILPDFAPGLDGLEVGHTINLITWNALAKREILRHASPSGQPAAGVFSGVREDRPNPIAVNTAVIAGIERQAGVPLVRLSALAVPDGTPVLDIKGSGRPGGRVDLELENAKNKLMRMCATAHAAGLLPAFNGNASLRLGEQCLITSSGTLKYALEPGDFAILDLPTGGLISGHRPSSEAAMHLEVYRQQPAAKVILHTHPRHLLALGVRLPNLTMQGRLSMPLFEGGRWSSLVGNVDALTPGGRELAEAVAGAAKTRQAVWMEKHGLCVWGVEPLETVAISEELDHLASIRLMGGFD